jgi:hypothetical protein
MATTLQKGLFGGDPVAMQAEQQKIWNQLYGQAGSPYEKMGIALGQLGGTLFGGESTMSSKTNAINKALENAAAMYQQGTPEYYKAVAEDPALANYADSKEFATQKYLEAKKAETAEFAAERKGVREDPGSVDVYAPKYATTLLNKARAKGFDPTTETVPETTEEIKAFAKLYALDTDPAYNKFMTLRTLSEKEAKKETMEAEKSALTMESIRTTIAKNKREINKIDSDKFEAGARWNEERNSAIALFDANKLDPRTPLKGINLANTELVNAQRIALRDPWTGKSGATIKQPGETTPPPVGGGKGDISKQATTAFGSYDTTKYDYRIVNGVVQRAPK